MSWPRVQGFRRAAPPPNPADAHDAHPFGAASCERKAFVRSYTAKNCRHKRWGRACALMQIPARYQRWRARAIMQIIADSTDGGGGGRAPPLETLLVTSTRRVPCLLLTRPSPPDSHFPSPSPPRQLDTLRVMLMMRAPWGLLQPVQKLAKHHLALSAVASAPGALDARRMPSGVGRPRVPQTAIP